MAHVPLPTNEPGGPPSTMELEPAAAVTVPPHVLLNPLGVATTNPVGKTSLTLRATKSSPFGLFMVRVKDVVPPTETRGAPNAFVMIGGETTRMLAVAWPPGPLWIDVMGEVTLFFTPGAVPVTSTLNWQAVMGAPFVRVIVFEPPTAVTVPPHVPDDPFGVATTRPAGKVSVKLTPVRFMPRPAKISNVRVVFPFTGIAGTPNFFVKLGGLGMITLMLAVAEAPGAFSLDVTVDVILFFTPGVVPVTLTLN